MSEDCGICKVKIKGRDQSLKCSGYCAKCFHPKCLELSNEEYSMINKNKNIKWFCDACIFKFDAMGVVNNEMEQLKTTIEEQMNEFKTLISSNTLLNKEHEIKEKKNKSFAEVVGEVVLIKPKTKQESKKTKDILRKAIDPGQLEVGITQIKDTKDGGVLIKCRNKEEIEKIKTAAEKKLKKDYQIKIPEKKLPKIKIVDIEENISKEKLVNFIKTNSFLNHEDIYLDVKVIKKMRTKYQAIVECDPLSLQLITAKDRICINFTMCRVFEYVSVFRCYKCANFDHKADDCTYEVKCLKCAKTDHKTEDCVSRNLTCIACVTSNEMLNLDLKTNHSVFDANCPSLVRKIEMEKRKIKTCSI